MIQKPSTILERIFPGLGELSGGKKVPAIALVLVNLIPLFGVVFLEWDAVTLLILFWVENLVLGIYTILRLFVASPFQSMPFIFFFLFHYGFFCLGHGIFVAVLTGIAAEDTSRVSLFEESWDQAEGFMEMLQSFVLYASPSSTDVFFIALLAIIISHGVSFVINILLEQKDRGKPLAKIMKAPYSRLIVLHVALIIGGGLVIFMGSPLIMLIVLMILKIGLDLRLHIKSALSPGH